MTEIEKRPLHGETLAEYIERVICGLPSARAVEQQQAIDVLQGRRNYFMEVSRPLTLLGRAS